MSTSNEEGKAKGGMDWMDRERFLKHYKLELAYEFTRDGNGADWADNGHRFWDNEDGSIELEKGDPIKNDMPQEASAALSPDNRFLAVGTNAVIRLYDIRSKEMVSELRAHEDHVDRMYFAPLPTGSAGGGVASGYTLVSSGEHGAREGQTFIWHLNDDGTHSGRNLGKIPHNRVTKMTNTAMKAVSHDINHHHKLEFTEKRKLRADVTAALEQAVSKSASKAIPMLYGELPTFGFANPISSDGKRVITIEKNESTQQGMRPLEEMPRIVVRDLDTLQETWRLTGHQDGIMWAGWSPDDKWVAEASWDETYGIWNPKVNDRAEGHLIGPSGGQNWVGDFSADGKYIVFSGGLAGASQTKVAVYEVETGEEIASLQHPRVSRRWVRELKWSPTDYTIAVVVAEHEVVLWHPLANNTYTSVLKIATDGTLLTTYNSFGLVKWIDDGQKLIVTDTANTVLMWDIRMNRKWRFERPFGVPLQTFAIQGVFFVKSLAKEGAVLSLDGDGRVRYWNL